MIDALVTHFTDQLRRRKENNEAEAASTHSTEEEGEGTNAVALLSITSSVINLFHCFFFSDANPINSGGNGVLSNKLHRLITITFEGGRCINQMGSLQISY